MSLLLSEGHHQARRYPLAFLWNETRIARRRVNGRMQTQGIVMQAVVASALGGGDHLKNVLRKLDDGE